MSRSRPVRLMREWHSTQLNVPFLNLMSLIVERAGSVHIRVGGNTQEDAYIVDSLADGKILEKGPKDPSVPVRLMLYNTSSFWLNTFTDFYSRSHLHCRSDIHACKRIEPTQREVVSE